MINHGRAPLNEMPETIFKFKLHTVLKSMMEPHTMLFYTTQSENPSFVQGIHTVHMAHLLVTHQIKRLHVPELTQYCSAFTP